MNYNREFANNAYFSLTYFIAKFFVELPLNLAPCVVFGIIAYFSAGLEYKRYGIYQLIVMLESITAVSLGLVAGSYSESAASASSFALSLIIINFIFGGFYSKCILLYFFVDTLIVMHYYSELCIVNLRSLPIVANWFPYVSMIRWSFEV